MTDKDICRRVAAVKTADAMNDIDGVPASQFAKELSLKWARGEITGDQMKQLLWAHHKALVSPESSKHGS